MLYCKPITSLALVAGLLVAFAGCGGGGDTPPLGTVSGKVTLNGEPLEGATVEFIPEQGRPSLGVTNDSGEYKLDYTASTPGALVGKHAVRITARRERSGGEGDQPLVEARPEVVPQAYNDQTTLSVTVEPGANRHDFTLEGQRQASTTPSA